ncbi:MAG: large conductance mechanosensitive channel protein MscL [Candidatus Saccharimonadia bacterium]
MLSEFKKFILRGNVVDLAVAVVVGAAFNTVIQALVKDIITPLIAAIGGQPDFAGLKFSIHHSVFSYGDFLNSLVSFLILAAVVFFFVVTPINKLNELANRNKKTEDPTTKKCPECLSEIPFSAKRCAFCTTKLSD